MNSVFKIIFWLCMVLVNVLVIGALGLIITGTSGEEKIISYFIALLGFLMTLVYMIIIPLFVIKDANKRDMDPWLWATIATFAPNFIGLIVYFIVRAKKPLQKSFCSACGKPLQDDFSMCPYCGQKQQSCKNCGKHLEHDWKVCPYCGTQQ